MRACAAAALALAYAPCSHQHNVVVHSFTLAVPRVARRHVNCKDRVSNWNASSSTTSRWVWRSESQLHAWKRLQLQDPDPFFQTCCAPLVEKARSSSAGRHGRTTNLRLQKHRKRKRKSTGKIMQCRTHWTKQVGALSAWFYSLARIFLSSRERFLRVSDQDPARQTETCEYTNRA